MSHSDRLAPEPPRAPDKTVAVVGMAGRTPWSPDPADIPRAGADEMAGEPVPPADSWSGPALFEPEFFGLSAQEAGRLDAAGRLLTELAYAALENAGAAPGAGDIPAGLFLGTPDSVPPGPVTETVAAALRLTGAGAAPAVAAPAAGDALPETGASPAADTCAPAGAEDGPVARAVRSLVAGRHPLALAAVARVGSTPASGAFAVVLKPWADAVRDGDRIHCLVRAEADGPESAAGDAPPGPRDAEDGAVTGFLAALAAVTRDGGDVRGGVTVGGVRLEAPRAPEPADATAPDAATGPDSAAPGSGVDPAAEHDVEHDADRAAASDTAAPAPASGAEHDTDRTAAPGSEPTPALTPWPLSAHSEGALRAQARRLLRHVGEHPEDGLADIGLSLATTRTPLRHRAVLLVADRADAVRALTALAEGDGTPGTVRGVAPAAGGTGGRPVFVFPGQGAQWAGMARELLDSSAVFRDHAHACAAVLDPLTGWSLLDVLRDAPGAPDTARVDVVQPALFAVMVSLAALWRSHGVEPAAVVGASLGEIAAAHVAGALSLEEAARVVVPWSAAQARVAGRGDMASVLLPRDELTPRLARFGDRLVFAGANGPRATLVSGERPAVAELLDELAADGVRARKLSNGLAAHSPQLHEEQSRLLADLRDVTPRPSDVPFYSSLTGGRLDTRRLDGTYWCRNIAEPIRFDEAARALVTAGHRTFAEISPHPVLTAGLQDTLDDAGAGADGVVVETLRRDHGGPGRFLAALAELHAHGVDADWTALPVLTGARRVDLPSYPFRTTAPDAGRGSALARRLAPLPAPEQLRLLDELVRSHASHLLGGSGSAPGAGDDRTFRELGLDSAAGVALRNRLRDATGLPLPTGLLYDHPTPAALAEHLRALLLDPRPEP
ncbi:acyltransferase domain-containing protein, partial [Streptomyces sp. URMC 126]|uniref:acyltransferase domain-containing protein n=1 Tax=Streptomyces sp. URMC 126 TaxID=3423401 RepID=UPI003F1A8B48